MSATTKTISRDDVRAGILEASLALMNEGGLGALSMREVARRAGVSHQAPYHYFADREAILAELAGDGFAQLYDYMVSALGFAKDKVGRYRAIGEVHGRELGLDPADVEEYLEGFNYTLGDRERDAMREFRKLTAEVNPEVAL